MDKQAARRVLRVLTAAFPTYPFEDDTAELYETLLMHEVDDGGLALEVAVDWAGERLTFPKAAELVEECRSEQTRRRRHARVTRQAQLQAAPGTVICSDCDDTGMVESRDHGVVLGPCPACRPEEAEYWAAGHYDADHDPKVCEHPRCKLRARQYARRRAG